MVEAKNLAPAILGLGVAGFIYAMSIKKENPELAENIALVVGAGASFTSLLISLAVLERQKETNELLITAVGVGR